MQTTDTVHVPCVEEVHAFIDVVIDVKRIDGESGLENAGYDVG